MKVNKNLLIAIALCINITGCGNSNQSFINKTDNTKSKEKAVISADEKKDVQMSTYSNPRFGFSISYPENFTLDKSSDNDDGAEFSLKNAKLLLYGSNNVLDDTSKSLYEEKLKTITPESIEHKEIGDNYFSISWREKGLVYNTKTVVGKGSINTFVFSYPEDERKIYDSISKQIEESFKTPGVDESH